MPNEIIIDGIEYELKRKLPKPKFKVDDAIQFADGSKNTKVIFRISHLSNDRYFLYGSNDYIQFIDQDKYELIGKYTFELVINAK